MSNETFSVAEDGPEIGSEVPREITPALPQRGEQEAYILLLSATYVPCHELAAELRAHRFEPPIVVLVPGPAELANDLVSHVPPKMYIVRDPEATAFAKALQIQSTPFAVGVESGIVVKKASVHHVSEFKALLETKHDLNLAEAEGRLQEVSHAA